MGCSKIISSGGDGISSRGLHLVIDVSREERGKLEYLKIPWMSRGMCQNTIEIFWLKSKEVSVFPT